MRKIRNALHRPRAGGADSTQPDGGSGQRHEILRIHASARHRYTLRADPYTRGRSSAGVFHRETVQFRAGSVWLQMVVERALRLHRVAFQLCGAQGSGRLAGGAGRESAVSAPFVVYHARRSQARLSCLHLIPVSLVARLSYRGGLLLQSQRDDDSGESCPGRGCDTPYRKRVGTLLWRSSGAAESTGQTVPGRPERKISGCSGPSHAHNTRKHPQIPG